MTARRAQIAVIGRGKPDAELEQLAEEVGRRIAESGAVMVCGGLGGVMEAAARGAGEAGGDVIGIVPGEDPSDANDHVTHVVASGIGYGRNLSVVASADAVIAVGGEWGDPLGDRLRLSPSPSGDRPPKLDRDRRQADRGTGDRGGHRRGRSG